MATPAIDLAPRYSATTYAARVAELRAPLLAEIAADETEATSLRADLAGELEGWERTHVSELLSLCELRIDHARGLLPSNTPMWG